MGEEIKQIAKSFQGEIVHFQNLNMPIRGIIDRFETGELCFDSSYQNIICYPIYDQDQFDLCRVFVTSKLYDGKEGNGKGKYIDNNWLEEFDIDELSSVVNLSRYHFTRLFKSNTGMTPYGYYQYVKIQKNQKNYAIKTCPWRRLFQAAVWIMTEIIQGYSKQR